MLDWEPKQPLRDGMQTTYEWIAQQVAQRHNRKRVA
jgi:hypothetical protein